MRYTHANRSNQSNKAHSPDTALLPTRKILCQKMKPIFRWHLCLVETGTPYCEWALCHSQQMDKIVRMPKKQSTSFFFFKLEKYSVSIQNQKWLLRWSLFRNTLSLKVEEIQWNTYINHKQAMRAPPFRLLDSSISIRRARMHIQSVLQCGINWS